MKIASDHLENEWNEFFKYHKGSWCYTSRIHTYFKYINYFKFILSYFISWSLSTLIVRTHVGSILSTGWITERAARLLILNKRKQNLNIIPRNVQALRATARSKITLWRHFYRSHRIPVSETFGAESVPNVYLFILFLFFFFHLFGSFSTFVVYLTCLCNCFQYISCFKQKRYSLAVFQWGSVFLEHCFSNAPLIFHSWLLFWLLAAFLSKKVFPSHFTKKNASEGLILKSAFDSM